MKIDSTGKIAFHCIRLREDGGSDFVQYGFDGKVESITEHRPAPIFINYGNA